MKYMTTGNYRAQVLMRLTLGCTLVFLTGFWITNTLLYLRNMDLRPQSVVDYYLGSDVEFAMPRTYGSMLEVAHMHLPMMAMVLLLLTHLCIFLPWPLRIRVALVLATFGCGLLTEVAGWLVRFVHPGFAWLKVGGFLGLQATLALLLLGLGLYLARRPRPVALNGIPTPQNYPPTHTPTLETLESR
jgi:hypothetical protein